MLKNNVTTETCRDCGIIRQTDTWASPELLDALMSVESFMKQITPKNDGWHKVQDKVRAAIRKAKGE